MARFSSAQQKDFLRMYGYTVELMRGAVAAHGNKDEEAMATVIAVMSQVLEAYEGRTVFQEPEEDAE